MLLVLSNSVLKYKIFVSKKSLDFSYWYKFRIYCRFYLISLVQYSMIPTMIPKNVPITFP